MTNIFSINNNSEYSFTNHYNVCFDSQSKSISTCPLHRFYSRTSRTYLPHQYSLTRGWWMSDCSCNLHLCRYPLRERHHRCTSKCNITLTLPYLYNIYSFYVNKPITTTIIIVLKHPLLELVCFFTDMRVYN